MEVTNRETSDITAQEPQATQQPRRPSRKRNIIIFVVVCVLNVGLLIVIGTQLLTPASPGQSNPGGAAAAIGEVNTPLLGKTAPNFTLPRLGDANSRVTLADLKGRPVVLNFWASWCAPCNDEAPLLQKSWTTSLQKQGVVLIGIDGAEQSDNDWRAFLQKHGITYLNLKDTVNGATAVDYGATGFPETIFIDRRGNVVAKVIKPLSEQAIDFEIAKII